MSDVSEASDGVVVLTAETPLPERVEGTMPLRELTPEEDPFLAAVLRVARPRPYWPSDYVLNHGHYTDGEPRR